MAFFLMTPQFRLFFFSVIAHFLHNSASGPFKLRTAISAKLAKTVVNLKLWDSESHDTTSLTDAED